MDNDHLKRTNMIVESVEKKIHSILDNCESKFYNFNQCPSSNSCSENSIELHSADENVGELLYKNYYTKNKFDTSEEIS